MACSGLGDIPQYLVIGHVTRDVLLQGGFRAGGTATYAALTAQRLGLRVGVLTSAAPEWPLLADAPAIAVVRRPAPDTTTFENRYSAGRRQQYLRSVAAVLTAADVPPEWRGVPIVHLGPVAQEVDESLLTAFSQALVGVTPQGWLRRWDATGRVWAVAWANAARVLERAYAVVLSPEDVGYDWQVIASYRRWARLLVVTLGAEGAIVYHGERAERVPAYIVQEMDPTGAGDVFAAAFFVRLHETGDALEAARFANSAASCVVEGLGAAMIPTRDQIEDRLRHGRLRA